MKDNEEVRGVKAIRFTNEIPRPRSGSGGNKLREDTQQMVNTLRANPGRVVVFDFYSDKELLNAYHRLKFAKGKGYVDYEIMSRRGGSLYVKTKKD